MCILQSFWRRDLSCAVFEHVEPAILIGDWLWIDKLTYGARLPVRWSDIPLINVFTWNRTLREKDRGTNWGYRRIKGFRSPCISDIIVFNSPERPDILLVKRVAGVISAGDTITFNRENYSSLKKILDNEYVSSFMRKNNIYINGRVIPVTGLSRITILC